MTTPDTPTTPPVSREVELHRERGYLAAAGPDAMTSSELYARAEVLARSKLVPKALENNPDGIFLVGMMGLELGVSLVNALSEIHVIEGRPSPSAQLRLSLIRKRGHEARYVETSDEKAIIRGRRAEDALDPDGWVTVEWTIEQARKAGLVDRWVERKYRQQNDRYDRTEKFVVGDDRGIYSEEDRRRLGLPVALPDWVVAELEAGRVKTKDNWQKYPADMLRARAASALFRMHFGDVVLATGIDELTPEERGVDVSLDLDETVREPADEIVDGEVVDEDGRVVEDPPAPAAGRALSGPAQISIALKARDITDRALKLRLVAAIVDREVTSTKDLTGPEVGLVLRTIDYCTSTEELLAIIEEPEAPAVVEEEPAADAAEIRVPEHEEPVATVPAAPREDPPAPLTDTAAGPPSTWSDAAWRAFLAERGVKVTELIREAQRLAREDGDQGPANLGELASCSTSLLDLLVGFVEDLSASRGGA